MSVNKSTRSDFPVVGSFAADPVTKIDAQRTINYYEVIDEESKKGKFLSPTYGLKKVHEFANDGKGRASIVFKDHIYFVQDDTIYRMDAAETIVSLSPPTFLTTTGYVGVAFNENQIAFVDGDKLLLWDETTSALTDETASIPAGFKFFDIVYMDGYFIAAAFESATNLKNRFFISGLNNGASWSVLDDAVVNIRPTILNGLAVLKHRFFTFGKINGEIWLDAGLADFPFRPDTNLLLDHGVLSNATISWGFDRLFYLAGDQDGFGGVMMITGTSPVKVSSREVDETISTFQAAHDSDGFVYKMDGQVFYQINFTTDQRTFVYNANTDKWHEMLMLDNTRHIARTMAYFNNKHYITSYADDGLYVANTNYLDNDGQEIKRTRICRILSTPTYNRVRIDRLQIDMLQGVGIIPSSTDSNPLVYLSISEDGGITYRDLGTAEIGRVGQYLKRTIWRSLGVRRDAIIKLDMFNKVRLYVLGGAFDYEILPE